MTEIKHKSPLGFSKYTISSDGQSVINIKTGQRLKLQFNPGNGYMEISLSSDIGVRRCGVHRLMGLSHLLVPVNHDELTVNHRDGVKTNNHKDNLEWMTYSENQEHAGANGLTTKCVPVCAINVDTGKVINYPSILKCSMDFNVSKDIMNFRVKSNGTDRIGSYVFVKLSMLSDFMSTFVLGGQDTINKDKDKPIWCKDLSTGMVLFFKNRKEVGIFFSVSPATVTGWLRRGRQVIINSRFLLKKKENEDWDETEGGAFIIGSGNYRPIVLINNQTKESLFYPSVVSFCQLSGLSPTCVNYRLSTKGGRVFIDGYRYYYQDELDTVRLPPGNR